MTGKRTAHRYLISVRPEFRKKILQNYRGKAGANWTRQHTSELWTPPYSELNATEYGAYRRLLMMVARSKESIESGNILTTKKELRSFGISDVVLYKVGQKVNEIDVTVITDDGEINDLPWD